MSRARRTTAGQPKPNAANCKLSLRVTTTRSGHYQRRCGSTASEKPAAPALERTLGETIA
eukprot:3266805-Lingulodinium_polyedra.AAC.1